MRALDRISGYAHVARRYGLEEAIFLDSLMFWYRENRANGRNFRDGRWWTYNSVSAFEELFPWWSGKQIRRIVNSCRDKGAILVGNYNSDRRDRTVWYTPSDELLALYGLSQTGFCICPFGQMVLSTMFFIVLSSSPYNAKTSSDKAYHIVLSIGLLL